MSINNLPSPRVIEQGLVVEAPAMFPAAARVEDTIVLAYSTVPDGWPGGEVRVTRSEDGGRTWSDAETVAAPGPGEDAVLGALGLTFLSDGRLLLPVNTIHWAGEGVSDRVAGLRLLESRDCGRTWVEQDASADFAWPAVYGTFLESGDRLLWPLWGRLVEGERWRSTLLAAPQSGGPWSLHGTIAYDPAARLRNDYVDSSNTARGADDTDTGSATFRPHDSTDGFSETSVCRLEDGSLLAIIRQQGVGGDTKLSLFRAWSFDEGHSWTTAVPVGFSGMSPALHRLPDGSLLLASRRHVPEGSDVTPAVEFRRGSADGMEWSEPVEALHPQGATLESEYQCGYPTIVDDGAGVRVFFYTLVAGRGRCIAWNLIAL